MFRMRTLAVCVMLGVCSMAAGQEPVALATVTPVPPRVPLELQALVAHGVKTTPEALIEFLNKGFPAGISKGSLPSKPVEKSQLVVDAMAQLARAGATQAVPVLSKIASGDFPPGVGGILQDDLMKTSPESRNAFQRNAARLLQYNAINALGLLGDASALPVVQAAFKNEQDAGPKIQYALNLASLGDASGVDFLLEMIGRENRRESVAAANVFQMITGQSFAYTENTAVALRKSRAKAYRDWWKANASTFRCDPAAVLKRRMEPEGEKPFEARTVRDLVKLSTFYFDFDNKFKTREARQKLQESGASLAPELEKVALDTHEDLNVRMEAMNWYMTGLKEKARPLLKKLMKDANPEVVDKAKFLLEELDSGQIPGVPTPATAPAAPPARR